MSVSINTTMTIYGQNAFKRYLLPAVENADYSVILKDALFGLSQTIELKLENIDNEWYFAKSTEYELVCIRDGNATPWESSFHEIVKSSLNEFKIVRQNSHILSVVIDQSDSSFIQYEKYSLCDWSDSITIGRGFDNTINYDFNHYISEKHAVIRKNGQSFFLQDLNSSNGSYLNNRRITGSIELRFGDCIDLFGLRIVFLNDIIAVNISECRATVSGKILQIAVECPKPVPRNKGKYPLKKVFHRAPRHIAKIETGEIKIDEPPAPREEIRQRGILAAISGAVSMSLPMLLGCAFMIYASRVSGFSHGIFMYVGIVTAVTSAIIGTVRSVTGMRNAIREYKEYEIRRNERYGQYLRKKEAYIKERYEKNIAALEDRYASAEECSLYAGFN